MCQQTVLFGKKYDYMQQRIIGYMKALQEITDKN